MSDFGSFKTKYFSLTLIVIVATITITWNISYLSLSAQSIIKLNANTNGNSDESMKSLSYLWQLNGVIPSYHTDYWKLYCLSTSEHCLPIIPCHNITHIKNGNGGEQISTCLDFLNKSNNKCLIYSVGIANAYNWDITMASQFGCEVHSFDPTIDLPTQLAPNVTFHKWGLRGSNINGSASRYKGDGNYKGISGEMLMLSDIIKRLGHENRKIDIIRIDCEGCEWEVFSDYETQKILCNTPQILTEFHYGMAFLPSVKNLTLVSKVYDFLNYCNFKQFFYEVNVHDAIFDRKMNQQFIDNSYLDAVTDNQGKPRCCREYGFLKADISTISY